MYSNSEQRSIVVTSKADICICVYSDADCCMHSCQSQRPPIHNNAKGLCENCRGRRTPSHRKYQTERECLHVAGRPIYLVRVHPLCVFVQLTRFDSPILSGSSKITFSILHERFLHDRCLGRFDIDVEELLERQRQQANDGEYLLLLIGFTKIDT
jgi:hypothetical protein